MTKLKLTYFDFHGGRGQTARLALSIGNVDYEDERIALSDWGARKPQSLYGVLPELTVDGRRLGQSGAINRYIGKLTGLYPEDPFQAAVCDEVLEAVEDLGLKVGATMFLPPEETKKKRQELVEGPIPFYLKRFTERLAEQGGEYFADERLTVADLKAFVSVRQITAGILDHVPPEIVQQLAPSLVAHRDRVAAHPGVRAYYEKHGVTI